MTEPNPDEPEPQHRNLPRFWLNLVVTATDQQDAEELVEILTDDGFVPVAMAYATVDPDLQPGEAERFQQALLKLAQLIEPGTPGEAQLQALIASTYYPEENWETMNMHARLGHMINGRDGEQSRIVEILAMSAHLRSPSFPVWRGTLENAMDAWERKVREFREDPDNFEE